MQGYMNLFRKFFESGLKLYNSIKFSSLTVCFICVLIANCCHTNISANNVLYLPLGWWMVHLKPKAKFM